MKKFKERFLCVTIGLALFCAGSPAWVSAQSAAGPDALDSAIREASTYLNGRVPKGSKAVFLNIRSDYPDLSEYILSVLSENAVNDGVFAVVDRQQLDSIRAELDFQTSGEVSDESAQSIGHMLGAQSIVSGAVSKIGSLYRVQVKAIEVQSAGVQGQWSRNVPTGMTIAALTERVASAAGASGAAPARSGAAAQTAAAAQPEVPVYDKEYKIGDTGPAGGIIFFDKGSNSGGWRYFEAAPSYMEVITRWGSGGNVSGTGIGVGQGKQNTQTITTYMQQKKESGTAAQTCQTLDQGGYTDWFLPSQAELNLMYLNLRKQGLGDFSNGWYWSSSQSGDRNSWAQDFNNGNQTDSYYSGGDKNRTNSVRAIRQF
jgi:hypothetical protein